VSTDLCHPCPLCQETAAFVGYSEHKTGKTYEYVCPNFHDSQIHVEYPEVTLARENEEEKPCER
jgi:hypothetical protein